MENDLVDVQRLRSFHSILKSPSSDFPYERIETSRAEIPEWAVQ
jgi:hypothetical protein